MAPCRQNRRSVLTLLVLLVGGLLTMAASSPVWKAAQSPEASQTERANFLPREDSKSGEALLIWSRLAEDPESFGPLKLEAVLGAMFGDFDSHRLLGRKLGEWGGRKAEVVSFEVQHGEKELLGRLLITHDGEAPLDVLVLVTRPGADPRFRKEFDHLQKVWNHRLSGTANVLYSK